MMIKENLLISSCLLGNRCRYDANSKPIDNHIILKLKEHFNLVPVCPEVMGGLPIPRLPSEICGNYVINSAGINVTNEYLTGAMRTLKIAKLFQCKYALLKAKSPSCGAFEIYDGTFTKVLKRGMGITASLLIQNNIIVINEDNISQII